MQPLLGTYSHCASRRHLTWSPALMPAFPFPAASRGDAPPVQSGGDLAKATLTYMSKHGLPLTREKWNGMNWGGDQRPSRVRN